MQLATLRRMLICGACSSLMWATPSQARFLQVDPVGYDDQFNLYAYVGNDPVNVKDPTGETMIPPENMDPNRDWSSRQGRAIAEATA